MLLTLNFLIMSIVRNSFKAVALVLLIALVTFSACKKDDPVTEVPVVILDGWYVKGTAAAYTDYNAKAMMKVTRNEVTQTNRASLLELYIPLKASGTFSIAKVAGSTKTVYGPVAASWGNITQGTTDEPKVTFQRGTIAANTATFSVPADGMYHVVIDFELNKAVIVPVNWGVIGAATPAGWGNSTDLTASAFNSTTMSWTKTGMELRGGDWKFRYSNGWKVELDTVLDLGAGKKGVKVNTNLGGAVAALVPGGDNIVNAAPGVYTMTLSYVLGTGYTATAVKTADLPETNWTGVKCDAVGSGVSVDNATSIPDPSSWNWGRKLLADNAGVPVKVGSVYTWTWTNMVIEANEGFKLRTENGVAPTTGGANFDAGFSAVDVAASSNKVVDNGGNLSVNVKGTFTVKLSIDAANSDAKKIIITQ